jgi:hypothetical protein
MLFFFWFAVLVFIKIAVGLGLVRYAGEKSESCSFVLCLGIILAWNALWCYRFLSLRRIVHLCLALPALNSLIFIILPAPLCVISGLIHNKELALKMAEESANANGSSRFERKISMNQLSNIERYTVYKGRVVG